MRFPMLHLLRGENRLGGESCRLFSPRHGGVDVRNALRSKRAPIAFENPTLKICKGLLCTVEISIRLEQVQAEGVDQHSVQFAALSRVASAGASHRMRSLPKLPKTRNRNSVCQGS